MKKVIKSYTYETLVSLFIMTLIVSNIASVKLVHIGPIVFDAGTVLFPLAYIIGDIITEVYGFRKMRRLLYLGVMTLVLATFTFFVVGLLPNAVAQHQAAYDTILGVVWRIVLASIVALFVGEFVNSYIMAQLKIKDRETRLWQRIVGSSAVGAFLDTFIFSTIAFFGTTSFSSLCSIIATVFTIKIVTEIIVSPFTIHLIGQIKKREKTDVYENPSWSLRG